MNEGELKKLLDKYYNGDSTDNEEMLLRDFFNNENVPGGYEAEKAIFSYFSSPVNIPEPIAITFFKAPATSAPSISFDPKT